MTLYNFLLVCYVSSLPGTQLKYMYGTHNTKCIRNLLPNYNIIPVIIAHYLAGRDLTSSERKQSASTATSLGECMLNERNSS